MTTDITVRKTEYQVEKRSWLLGPVGTEPGQTPSITLDLAAFATNRYPNGFIPSGTVLGKITTSGLYGPYDNAATDGTEVARGLLFSSIHVPAATGKVGGALLKAGNIDATKLPFTSGKGSFDANAITDLKFIDSFAY